MVGWTKLFSSIVTSSVWMEDNATRIVWIAMLALADADGVVEGSVPGFANLARVTREEMDQAIENLSAPDPDSRTTDFDGRRIEPIAGGWQILNHGAYRERPQTGEGSRAPYHRMYRARKKLEKTGQGVAQHVAQPESVARVTEERGEKQDTEADQEKKQKKARTYADIRWNPNIVNLTHPGLGGFEGGDLAAAQATLGTLYNADLGISWIYSTWNSMFEWCVANPEKIAAKKDVKSFILTWFRGDAKKARERQQTSPGRRAELEREALCGQSEFPEPVTIETPVPKSYLEAREREKTRSDEEKRKRREARETDAQEKHA